MMIRGDAHLEHRFRNLEERAGTIDQLIERMRLETNHVPVLDRKLAALQSLIAAMQLQTDHVHALDRKLAVLESHNLAT